MDGQMETALDGRTNLENLPETSRPYVGRWNQLVSTTNWEKGRIIFQWREAQAAVEASPAEYSDEAWGRLVGGVTGQHVGRLRRVYQRFDQVFTDYDGLYWSHFHAALDWDDAEMWLEGGVQNHWSVSQMRRKRWETLGHGIGAEPSDEDVLNNELDEDFEPALNEQPLPAIISGTYAEVDGGPQSKEKSAADATSKSEAGKARQASNKSGAAIYADDDDKPTVQFVRPFENLADLPDDLADAFEAYKLAILRHKTDDWKQISREEVLGSLDALKELVVAPSIALESF